MRTLAIHPDYDFGCVFTLLSAVWEEQKEGFPPQFWFKLCNSLTCDRLYIPESHLTGETYCRELRSYDLIYDKKYIKKVPSSLSSETGVWTKNPKNTVNKAPQTSDPYFLQDNKCQAILPCGRLCGRKVVKFKCGPTKCKISWENHNQGVLPKARGSGRMLPLGVPTHRMKRRSRLNFAKARAAKRRKY